MLMKPLVLPAYIETRHTLSLKIAIIQETKPLHLAYNESLEAHYVGPRSI